MAVGRLLILDGYGSHLTYEFYEYALKHKIELFAPPTHSTHLMQPLDVGCFQPYKHYHSKAIAMTTRNGIPELSKLTTMRAKTFKNSTILFAFKKIVQCWDGIAENSLNHFNVKIIRPVITKRHKIWRREQKKPNFKLQWRTWLYSNVGRLEQAPQAFIGSGSTLTIK